MSKPEGYPFIGEPTGLKVIIVGAGLGGLACAIECRRKGLQVIVFENAPEIMRIGDTLVHIPSLSVHYALPLFLCVFFNISVPPAWLTFVLGNRSKRGETNLPLGNPRSNRPSLRPHGPFQDLP